MLVNQFSANTAKALVSFVSFVAGPIGWRIRPLAMACLNSTEASTGAARVPAFARMPHGDDKPGGTRGAGH